MTIVKICHVKRLYETKEKLILQMFIQALHNDK